MRFVVLLFLLSIYVYFKGCSAGMDFWRKKLSLSDIRHRYLHYFILHITFKGPLTDDAAESVGQPGDAAPAADLADPGDKCSLLLNMQALELRLGLREEILYH